MRTIVRHAYALHALTHAGACFALKLHMIFIPGADQAQMFKTFVTLHMLQLYLPVPVMHFPSPYHSRIEKHRALFKRAV